MDRLRLAISVLLSSEPAGDGAVGDLDASFTQPALQFGNAGACGVHRAQFGRVAVEPGEALPVLALAQGACLLVQGGDSRFCVEAG